MTLCYVRAEDAKRHGLKSQKPPTGEPQRDFSLKGGGMQTRGLSQTEYDLIAALRVMVSIYRELAKSSKAPLAIPQLMEAENAIAKAEGR